MPKSKVQKQAQINVLSDKIKQSEALLVVTPSDVNPNEAAELKIKLAEIGGEYHVVKNTLFAKALTDLGYEGSAAFGDGRQAVVFVGSQSPEAAKLLKQFAKASEKIAFKGGYLEGKAMTAQDVQSLADLPSREQMLAQVLATMNAPITGFVQVLAGNVRSVINVIDAYQKAKSAD